MTTAIDIERDTLLAVPDGVQEFLAAKTNRRPAAATVQNWCQRGVRGHRLPTLKLGWGVFTSVKALGEWAAATAAGGGE